LRHDPALHREEGPGSSTVCLPAPSPRWYFSQRRHIGRVIAKEGSHSTPCHFPPGIFLDLTMPHLGAGGAGISRHEKKPGNDGKQSKQIVHHVARLAWGRQNPSPQNPCDRDTGTSAVTRGWHLEVWRTFTETRASRDRVTARCSSGHQCDGGLAARV
jgi:hypothetical protein